MCAPGVLSIIWTVGSEVCQAAADSYVRFIFTVTKVARFDMPTYELPPARPGVPQDYASAYHAPLATILVLP